MSTDLLRYRDVFMSLTNDPTNDVAPHAFALAPSPDGIVVYCEACDTDHTDATHCCPHNRGPWGEVCPTCEKQDWFLDLCEAYWESRYDY